MRRSGRIPVKKKTFSPSPEKGRGPAGVDECVEVTPNAEQCEESMTPSTLSASTRRKRSSVTRDEDSQNRAVLPNIHQSILLNTESLVAGEDAPPLKRAFVPRKLFSLSADNGEGYADDEEVLHDSRRSLAPLHRKSRKRTSTQRDFNSAERGNETDDEDAQGSQWVPLARWTTQANLADAETERHESYSSRTQRLRSLFTAPLLPPSRVRNRKVAFSPSPERARSRSKTPVVARRAKKRSVDPAQAQHDGVNRHNMELVNVMLSDEEGFALTLEDPEEGMMQPAVAAYEEVETIAEGDALELVDIMLSDEEDPAPTLGDSASRIRNRKLAFSPSPGRSRSRSNTPAVGEQGKKKSVDLAQAQHDGGNHNEMELISLMLSDEEDPALTSGDPEECRRTVAALKGSDLNAKGMTVDDLDELVDFMLSDEEQPVPLATTPASSRGSCVGVGGLGSSSTRSPSTPAAQKMRRLRARRKENERKRLSWEKKKAAVQNTQSNAFPSTPHSGQSTAVLTTPLSAKSDPSPGAIRMRKARRSLLPLSIYPKPVHTSNVGKLTKRCPHCLALHYPKEKFRCCNSGKVKFEEPKVPPPVLLDLLLGESATAKKHQSELCKMNTLFSMAGKSCNTETVPGRGVPIVKIRGGYTHTVSSIRTAPNATARFGSLFTYDPKDATAERIDNKRLSQNCDPHLLLDLSQEFAENNVMCAKFKFMGEVLEDAERANGGVLPSVYMRLVPRDEGMNNAAAKKLMGNDHPGRYNTGDDTMVCFIFKTDDEGTPLLPKGLNVYPYHDGGPGKVIPFFDPRINVLCYTFIHPYGNVDFTNGKIKFVKDPKPMNEDQIKECIDFAEHCLNLYMEKGDTDAEEVNVKNNSDDPGSSDESDVEAVLEKDADGEDLTDDEAVEEEEVLEGEDGNRILTDVDDEGLEDDPPGNDEAEDLPLRTAPAPAPIQDTEESAHLSGEESGESDIEQDEESEIEENPEGTDKEDELDDGISLEDKEARHVSHLQYLRYRLRVLMKSKFAYHNIISATRVSQHYIIDNLLRIFEQRMWHVQMNNTQTLGSKKNTFLSTMSKAAEKRGRRLGMTVNVPKNVKVGPAYLRAKYENTMSMIAEIGNPDLFVTFTGNRKWPEIERYRKPGQTWADIAHIAVRVFFEKFEEFKKGVLTSTSKKGGLFGKVKGFAYSIELQQRGMPHAHVLITLEDDCKLNTPEKVDDVVWAQFPDLKKYSETDPRWKEMKELRELVAKHMVHTPCEGHADAYCKKKQAAKKNKYTRCDKGFPKEFLDHTTFHEDGYVLPRRPDNGQYVEKIIDYKSKKSVKATNQHVVPFNPTLLKTFDCHINVEICSTVKAAKYIFKYIFKGFDKTLVEFIESCRISNGTRRGAANMSSVTIGGHVILPHGAVVNRAKRVAMEKEAEKRLKAHNVPVIDANGKKTLVYDETKILEVMRSMTVTEALLSIYQIPTAYTSHAVVPLAVHLPDEETIYWRKGTEEARAEALERPKATSKLTAWFALNVADPAARSLTYAEIPKHYFWKQTTMKWMKRTKNRKIVSRVYSVSPRYAQQFALRLLTMNVAGATCFMDLKTFDGIVYETFVDAARARGLMNDEREWEHAMEAAVLKDMPIVIRRLFATICAYCPVKDKQGLFDKFAVHMFDNPRDTTIPEATKRARALFHIESILKHNRLTNKDVALEEVDVGALDWGRYERSRNDENYVTRVSPEEARRKADDMLATMNAQQRKAFDILYKAANPRGSRRCFFLEGAGGTGKTYVYKALYYSLVADGIKVLMVAHTGIAATLLINGTTVHRQFCIPINATGDATCNVQPESAVDLALHQAEVVIWDEATMSDRRVLAAVDKLLREVEPTDDRPFGGKMMLLGGDWKQLLPVVRNVHSREILDYTIKRSSLWPNFVVLKLTKNMRVDQGAEEFAELLDLIGRADPAVQNEDGTVAIEADMCMQSEDHVIKWAYKGNLDVSSCDAIRETCILTTLNDATHEINDKVLDMLPGQEHVMKSYDKCSKDNNYMEMPADIYNGITPSGLPPHILKLKKGCVVVLLRNLNVPRGQCNGTRMRVVDIDPNLLSCEIITEGRYKGEEVLIPKIEMEPQDQRDPTHCFKRLQFPVRLAYAMTVNKAQGQSLKKVGLVLRTPVFAHGQLYVALSRARTRDGVKIWQHNTSEDNASINVQNIVFKEILK